MIPWSQTLGLQALHTLPLHHRVKTLPPLVHGHARTCTTGGAQRGPRDERDVAEAVAAPHPAGEAELRVRTKSSHETFARGVTVSSLWCARCTHHAVVVSHRGSFVREEGCTLRVNDVNVHTCVHTFQGATFSRSLAEKKSSWTCYFCYPSLCSFMQVSSLPACVPSQASLIERSFFYTKRPSLRNTIYECVLVPNRIHQFNRMQWLPAERAEPLHRLSSTFFTSFGCSITAKVWTAQPNCA